MGTSNALCVTGYMVSRKKLAQNVRAPCVGVYVCNRLNMTNWMVNKYWWMLFIYIGYIFFLSIHCLADNYFYSITGLPTMTKAGVTKKKINICRHSFGSGSWPIQPPAPRAFSGPKCIYTRWQTTANARCSLYLAGYTCHTPIETTQKRYMCWHLCRLILISWIYTFIRAARGHSLLWRHTQHIHKNHDRMTSSQMCLLKKQ